MDIGALNGFNTSSGAVALPDRCTLYRTYGLTGTGATSTSISNVVVGIGEKIVVTVCHSEAGAACTQVDWGTEVNVGTLVSITQEPLESSLEIWEVENPTAGTQTLTVQYTTTHTCHIGVFVFANAGPCSDVTTGTTSAATSHPIAVPNVTAEDYVVYIYAASGNIVNPDDTVELSVRGTSVNGQSMSGHKDGAFGGTVSYTSGADRDTSYIGVRIPRASVIKYFVNSNSTSGGSGTTNNTTGDDRAFDDIGVAVQETSVDSVYKRQSHIFYVDGGAIGTCTDNRFAGWVTSPDYELTIQPISRQKFAGTKWDTTKPIMGQGTAQGRVFQIGIVNDPQWVNLYGLQLEGNNDTNNFSEVIGLGAQAMRIRIDGCYIRCSATRTSNSAIVHIDASQVELEFTNNIVHHRNLTGGNRVFRSNSNFLTIYNNTFIGSAASDSAVVWLNSTSSNKGEIKNNIIISTGGAGPAYLNTGTIISDANLTSDTSSPDGASFQSQTPTFVSDVSFALSRQDTVAINKGVSVVNVLADTDIYGTTRPQGDSYDIGAFEALTNASIENTTLANVDGQTAHVITLDAAPVSGNTLIVAVMGYANVLSVTDNGGSSPTYTLDHSITAHPDSVIYYYRRSNVDDAPTTVTINLASSNSIRGSIYEVYGLANTDVVGQTNVGETGINTIRPTTSVTTTSSNELGLALLNSSTSRTITPPTGWTIDTIGNTPGEVHLLTDVDLDSAGLVTVDPISDAGANMYFGMITYKMAATAPVYVRYRKLKGFV